MRGKALHTAHTAPQCHHLATLYYTVSQKNDSDVAHYIFNAHQPILEFLAELLLKEYAIKR